MKKQLLIFFAVFTTFCTYLYSADNKDTCVFFIDINSAKNHTVEVVFTPPTIKNDSIIYRLPATVPGTYEILNFGSFITSFKAIAKDGKMLNVEPLDINSWKISNATQLNKISYVVEDTWHAENKGSIIFEPAGTNIEEGKNITLNTFGFCGYIDGYKNNPVSLHISHPEKFYGSTALNDLNIDSKNDRFVTNDYMRLADSPVMYCEPDTSILNIGGAEILISVYSKEKKIASSFVAKNIKTILEAQKNYLGGKLPIQKYAFIIYLYTGKSRSGSSGALEHSYSSFYYMEEKEPEEIVQALRDVASHEFFHIITPLGIHSEEIGNFDYANPQMSKHLWLYEGVTEYFAGHVQVQNNIITKEKYLEMLRRKISESEYFIDTLAFTEMSKKCLTEYKDQYMNVYEKGALIGMCIDIQLRSISGGEYGLNKLLIDLFKKYGPEKSFNDSEIIDTIVSMTHPGMRDFFTQHIEGNKPLPLKELFAMTGITYEKNKSAELYHVLGGAEIVYDSDSEKYLITKVTSPAKKMKLKKFDVLVSVNNEAVNPENIRKLLIQESEKKINETFVTVSRTKKLGKKSKLITLKSTTTKVTVFEKHHLNYNDNCSSTEIALRNSWLYGKK